MLRRQERRAAGEGVTEGGRPRPLQSPSPRLLPRSPPADSNGHRCQWSPQSPALPASWATWRLRVKSPETQTGARRLREWCRPPWEPSRGSETEEWRPAPRRCAHPGRGEAGSEGEGGGDAETRGHSPAVALGTVLSLAQKLHRTQMSASSLLMWPGEGRSTRPAGRRGEESRTQWGSGQSWRGCSLQGRHQAHQEPGHLPPQGRVQAPLERPGRDVRAAVSHSCVGSRVDTQLHTSGLSLTHTQIL